MTSEQSPKLFN